jgi:hypothetical protein
LFFFQTISKTLCKISKSFFFLAQQFQKSLEHRNAFSSDRESFSSFLDLCMCRLRKTFLSSVSRTCDTCFINPMLEQSETFLRQTSVFLYGFAVSWKGEFCAMFFRFRGPVLETFQERKICRYLSPLQREELRRKRIGGIGADNQSVP